LLGRVVASAAAAWDLGGAHPEGLDLDFDGLGGVEGVGLLQGAAGDGDHVDGEGRAGEFLGELGARGGDGGGGLALFRHVLGVRETSGERERGKW
jgi:hypothetical protein